MNRSFAFILIAALALCASQVCQAAEKKNPEANKLAREGAEAAKSQDYDQALADYSELIKLKPNEIKYVNYRAYIYEIKNDLQNSMADNEKILKVDPNNQDAKARKQRLEQKIAERTPLTPPPRSPTASPAPKGEKKP